jgi:hypothetical protein
MGGNMDLLAHPHPICRASKGAVICVFLYRHAPSSTSCTYPCAVQYWPVQCPGLCRCTAGLQESSSVQLCTLVCVLQNRQY